MSLSEEVELLKNIPLFANIEKSKLKLLAFTSERVGFSAGQMLFEQDDPAEAAYIIIAGEAEVMVRTPSGPRAITTVGRNDIVGEIGILCDMPRTATIRAKTDLVTLMITKDQFLRLISEFPQMALEIMRVLAQRLERTTRAAYGS